MRMESTYCPCSVFAPQSSNSHTGVHAPLRPRLRSSASRHASKDSRRPENIRTTTRRPRVSLVTVHVFRGTPCAPFTRMSFKRGFSTGIVALTLAIPAVADAHCDTMDGPVIKAAQAALASGDITPALIWIQPAADQEVREAFARAIQVRRKSTRLNSSHGYISYAAFR